MRRRRSRRTWCNRGVRRRARRSPSGSPAITRRTTRTDKPRMRVTLTFDNGPDPDVTPRVLDVLRQRAVSAHFYVLGKWLGEPARRRCVARAADEGHIVGNHSFSHAVPLGDDPRPDAVMREIAATEALLAPIVREKWFRPFGGAGALGPHLLSRAAVDFLTMSGYSCVLWNSVPRDWAEPDAW